MEEILLGLAKISPIVAILIYVMWYLKSRLETKESEIKELNTQLRESEKSAIEAFNKISDVIKTMSMDQTMSNKEVVSELKNLKEWLKEQIIK